MFLAIPIKYGRNNTVSGGRGGKKVKILGLTILSLTILYWQ